MRLIAVNSRCALYLLDEKGGKIDPVGFISALMEVRTARDLLNLLIEHGDTIATYEFFTNLDSRFEADEPWFSEGAIKDAIDTLMQRSGLQLRYENDLSDKQARLDSISTNDLINRINAMSGDESVTIDELLSSVKRYQVLEVYLDKIHDRARRWEALFTYAAIANGATPPQGFITSQDDKANVFAIHHEAIEKAMPDGHFPLWDYFKSHRDKITKEVGREFGNGLHMSVTRQMCVFNLVNVPNDPQTLLRLTCGRIAADGINEWTTYGGAYNQSTIWQRVEFDIEGGYRITDKTDLVIDALRNLIVSNRIRLCAVCGRPFVIKRKGRQYCGDVCKQKAFTARKEGR